MIDFNGLWGSETLYKITVEYKKVFETKRAVYHCSFRKKQQAIDYLQKQLREDCKIIKVSRVGLQNSGVMWSNIELKKYRGE